MDAPMTMHVCTRGRIPLHPRGYDVCSKCMRGREMVDDMKEARAAQRVAAETMRRQQSQIETLLKNQENQKIRHKEERAQSDKKLSLFQKMLQDREANRQKEADKLKEERDAAQRRADDARREADEQRAKEIAALKAAQQTMKTELNQKVAAAQEDAKSQREKLKKNQKELKEKLGEQRDTLSDHLKEKKADRDEIHGRAEGIKSEIEHEEKEMSKFEVERLDQSSRIIVTLGMTGSSKSTLCNRINGDDSKFGNKGSAQTSGNGKSCTQSNSTHRVEIGGHLVTVVDTPGIADSLGRDRQHSINLCKFLKGCGGINGFVLVRNGANVRFDSHFQNMLKDYYKMFGKEFLSRLIIVATRIEGVAFEQYFEYNQEESLREDICKLFGVEDVVIPVIPIGFDSYTFSIEAMVEAIPSDKHEFKEIKSPLDDLRVKYAEVVKEEEAMNEKVRKIELQIKALNSEIARIPV